MNTLENNKLIAEFMGIKPDMHKPGVYSYSDMPFYSIQEDTPEKVMEGFCKYAKYDASWHWIMPVAQKILSVEFKIECKDKGINIYSHTGRFLPNRVYDGFTGKITEMYEAVVEFIKWYNQNNS